MTGTDGRRRLLRIHLNDHLMVVAGSIHLARRSLGSNRGTALGDDLEALLAEVVQERAVLEGLMADLGCRVNRFKLAAAAVGERLGRLKFNGSLVGYSDLSRLLELEALLAAVEHKLRLWRSLRRAQGAAAFGERNFAPLIERAQQQRERLEMHRLTAAHRLYG